MSQAASFFQQCEMNLHGLLPCSLPLVCSSVRNEFVFQLVKRGSTGRFPFQRPVNLKFDFLEGKWWTSKKLLCIWVYWGEEELKKNFPGYSASVQFCLQPVKLLFLSNSGARSLEIISIMCGSSMQAQAGGKRAELHVVSGNLRFQIMQKEKASGPG